MPDVRCAFGLVRQHTRRPSLTPSSSSRPGLWHCFLPVRFNSAGIRPALARPVPGVSSGAGPLAPAAVFSVRPGKSNTQTIPRASLLPVLTRSVPSSFPSRGGHHSSRPTVPPVSRQPSTSPDTRIPAMPSFTAPLFTGTPSVRGSFRSRGLSVPGASRTVPLPALVPTCTSHLTPACSGLAALAADARR